MTVQLATTAQGTRLSRRLGRAAAVAALSITGLVGAVGLAPAANAASTLQPANCNMNVDTGARTIVVRAPHITSNNGGTQSVRFRSYLRKWNGSTWVVPDGAIGSWHQGTATPNSAYTGPVGTWNTNTVYGNGYYQAGIQVQYYNGGWGGQTTQVITGYYDNYFYSGVWHYEGNSSYCS